MFAHRMGLQVVSMVKVRLTNVALVAGHLSAFVSDVSAQGISVFVPFTARFARPTFVVWKKNTEMKL